MEKGKGAMHVAVGCDHKGLELKQMIIKLLVELGHSYEDFGCYDSAPVDYVDIARGVAEAVAARQAEQGILVCSTGIGMSIASNKVKGVRAALCHDLFSGHRARQHNDANVLCLGGDVIGHGLTREIVKTYLQAGFEGGRHIPRLAKVRALES